MKAPPFEYRYARESAEAVGLVSDFDGHAKYLAGGQSLGPMLNLRLAQPGRLIDIRGCADLRFCDDQGTSVVYGATLTHADFEDGAVPDVTHGLLQLAASRIAYRAIRNRGTLGGSIAHADPAADWLTVMLALDADVVTRGVEGLRARRMREFVRGPFDTELRASDVVVGIRVRRRSDAARYGYAKLAIKEGEFGEAFACFVEDKAGGEARVCIGAIERKPAIAEGDAVAALLDSAGALGECETLVDELVPGLAPVALRSCAANLQRALTRSWTELG